MPTDFSRYLPVAIALLAVFAIYRRLRRNFGRQPVAPLRMSVRIALLIAVGCALLPFALKSADFLVAEFAGGAAGIALAFWGSQRTMYQRAGGQVYYVPHTFTGFAVSLLFVGRMTYRVVTMYISGQMTNAQLIGTANAGTDAPNVAPPQMMQSPMTVGVFFVLIGYYVCFYAWVLWKSKHLKPEDLEEPRSRTLS